MYFPLATNQKSQCSMCEDHRDYGSCNGVNFKSGKGNVKSVHEGGKRVVLRERFWL